jgi:hypothetical protein
VGSHTNGTQNDTKQYIERLKNFERVCVLYFDVLAVQYSVQLIVDVFAVQYVIHLIATVLTVQYNPINCTCNHKYLFCSASAVCCGFYKPSTDRSWSKE